MAKKFGAAKDDKAGSKCGTCGAVLASPAALTRHEVDKHGRGKPSPFGGQGK